MQREERREQVLRSAMEVFAHKGYHATSVGDIIKRAQIAPRRRALRGRGGRSPPQWSR